MLFRKLVITLLLGWEIKGQGVEPSVNENIGLPPVMGGMKVRLG